MWRVALVLAAACGRVSFGARTDAHAPPDASCTWSAFSLPTRLPGLINSSDDDWSPTPALDETVLYFFSYRAGSIGSDIWVATRPTKTDVFAAASLVPELDTAGNESSPTLTADGLGMVFGRDGDLYGTTRATTADTFATPIALSIDTVDDEQDPFVTSDGTRMVFASARSGTGLDIYETTLGAGDVLTPPMIHAELDSTVDDYTPTLSDDGLDIWFSSARPGGIGMDDIYTAHRATLDQPFSTPVLVPELSSARDDNGVRLSRDGKTMYLNYDTLTSGGANADLYTATRTCL